MDSFRRDPGETSERGAKRPRLPAVFEAVKAGRFDELSLTSEIVPPKRRGYSVKAWENRDDLELEA